MAAQPALEPLVIVGGGLASQRCVERLRRFGWEGEIIMISAEPHLPYDRPPLSKAFLAGDLDEAGLHFRDQAWHDEQQVRLLLGQAAVSLDPEAQTVTLADGQQIAYGTLVIATGSRARQLPQTAELDNVLSLRSLDDARWLRDQLQPGARLVVLGAGLIGQEVASTASKLGAEVTLVEAAPLPLLRALHPEMSQWLVELQRQAGVTVHLGDGVSDFVHDGTRLEGLVLDSGERVDADLLLVAIGIQPNSDWLPLPLAELLERPEIYAAGDVAGGDHWELAGFQGRAVADAIMGRDPLPLPLTSWWSDVHGLRLQGLGTPEGADAIEITPGEDKNAFSAVYFRQGKPIGALAVQSPRELPRLKTLLQEN